MLWKIIFKFKTNCHFVASDITWYKIEILTYEGFLLAIYPEM